MTLKRFAITWTAVHFSFGLLLGLLLTRPA